MERGLDALWLTKKLVAFNTVNPPGAEGSAARFLGELLKESGFEVSEHDFDTERTSVVARLPSAPGRPFLCFTGHLDTVPLGAGTWSRDSFGGGSRGGPDLRKGNR